MPALATNARCEGRSCLGKAAQTLGKKQGNGGQRVRDAIGQLVQGRDWDSGNGHHLTLLIAMLGWGRTVWEELCVRRFQTGVQRKGENAGNREHEACSSDKHLKASMRWLSSSWWSFP